MAVLKKFNLFSWICFNNPWDVFETWQQSSCDKGLAYSFESHTAVYWNSSNLNHLSGQNKKVTVSWICCPEFHHNGLIKTLLNTLNSPSINDLFAKVLPKLAVWLHWGTVEVGPCWEGICNRPTDVCFQDGEAVFTVVSALQTGHYDRSCTDAILEWMHMTHSVTRQNFCYLGGTKFHSDEHHSNALLIIWMKQCLLGIMVI